LTFPIHLVGSIPLKDAADVFSTVAATIGDHVHKVPDGETGVRSRWLLWQQAVFDRCPQLVSVETESGYSEKDAEYHLRPSVSADQVDFGDLGYAGAALESFPSFKALKDQGKFKPDARFQVSLPTPLAVAHAFFAPEIIGDIEPFYEQAMMREVGNIIDGIPAGELAIQWDVAVEFMILEMAEDAPVHFADRLGGIRDRLARLADSIPSDVETGFHLCYGDTDHEHFLEPVDMTRLVEVANNLTRGARRTIDWIHMPVPRDRTDEDYFRPLQSLSLSRDTQLYIGLIHYTDGVAGARSRMATAEKFVSSFGIATECGFGRRDPETVVELLKIHDEVASARS